MSLVLVYGYKLHLCIEARIVSDVWPLLVCDRGKHFVFFFNNFPLEKSCDGLKLLGRN